VLKPTLRFEGKPGEQWTCFFRDPSGNNLEFKARGRGRGHCDHCPCSISPPPPPPPTTTTTTTAPSCQAMTKPENLFAKYYVE
jgi:hypothetical protein